VRRKEKLVEELVKFGGAILWLVGLIALFVQPVFGVGVLVVALLMSVWSAQRTRQRRHEEIVEAARSK
jgi:Na+/H+ antiporter NhaD/arsenite permease-like protein